LEDAAVIGQSSNLGRPARHRNRAVPRTWHQWIPDGMRLIYSITEQIKA